VSERERLNQLASEVILLLKLQLACNLNGWRENKFVVM
jgi:hypothetical protein